MGGWGGRGVVGGKRGGGEKGWWGGRGVVGGGERGGSGVGVHGP